MTLQQSLLTLFTEVFEGTAPGADGTWFVQGGEALDESLAALNAEQASWRPSPASSSIAAHVVHMTHYLEMSNSHGRGQPFQADWAGSWRTQTVGTEAWADAVAALRQQKGLLLGLIGEEGVAYNDGAVFGAIANIAHAAYHLGAIRQLYVLGGFGTR